MTIDLREYEKDLRKAVKVRNAGEKTWKWSIIEVTKTECRVAWGYLDYVGMPDDKKRDYFAIRVCQADDTPTDQYLMCYDEHGNAMDCSYDAENPLDMLYALMTLASRTY